MAERANDDSTPQAELSPRLRLAVSCIAWIAAGSLAWGFVLSVSGLIQTARFGDASATIPLSLRYTALLSLPVAVAHGAAMLLWRRSSRWLLWSALVAAVVLAYPAYALAQFLCSGDWISSMSWAPALRAVLFAGALFVSSAAWCWHCLVAPHTRARIAESPRLAGRLARSPAGTAALFIVGAGVAATSLWVAAAHLAAYTPLAQALTAGAWFAVATMAYAAVNALGPSRRPVLAVALFWIAGAAILACIDAYRVSAIPHNGRIASLVSMTVTWRPPPAVRFDISTPAAFDCSPEPGPARLPLAGVSEDQRRNVIVIFVDALRSDTLGERSGDSSLTPNLDTFGRESLRFERAQTTYPATLFAMASALSGRSPSEVLLAPTFPKNLLSSAGGRFDEIHVSLPDDVWFDLPAVEQVLLQGTVPERLPDARAQTARAIEVLSEQRAGGGRILAWIHYYEPHMPYISHRGFEHGGGLRGAYLSEVAFVDDALGPLFEHLERNGWYQDSLVIVAADHGQALGEHGYYGHHVYLTRPLTSIPLLVRAPGLKPGSDRDPVSVADIAPTVMHFAGLPVPTDTAAKSLLAPRTPGSAAREIVAEAFPLRGKWLFDFAAMRLSGLAGLKTKTQVLQTNLGGYSPKAALIGDRYRLIVDRVTGTVELYDDHGDPANEVNIAAEHPDLVAQMTSRLAIWHAAASARAYCGVTRAGAVGD